jgi:hypothetical protein
MTILDVRDFYRRRDALAATGGEAPCTGCDKPLARGDAYSIYDLAKPRAPRAFPMTINLCKPCTYMVMEVNFEKPPDP